MILTSYCEGLTDKFGGVKSLFLDMRVKANGDRSSQINKFSAKEAMG
jgi:hypothetical protein